MKSDTELKRDVCVRLELDPELDAAGLGVSAKNGVVTLEGKLHDGKERDATERAVKLVPGVKGLVDRIRVEESEAESPSDAELAARAADAILWLTTVPPENVSATVQDGWVNLKGVVESSYQRETLESIMWHLPQARGVNNLLKVRAESGRRVEPELTRAA